MSFNPPNFSVMPDPEGKKPYVSDALATEVWIKVAESGMRGITTKELCDILQRPFSSIRPAVNKLERLSTIEKVDSSIQREARYRLNEDARRAQHKTVLTSKFNPEKNDYQSIGQFWEDTKAAVSQNKFEAENIYLRFVLSISYYYLAAYWAEQYLNNPSPNSDESRIARTNMIQNQKTARTMLANLLKRVRRLEVICEELLAESRLMTDIPKELAVLLTSNPESPLHEDLADIRDNADAIRKFYKNSITVDPNRVESLLD